MLHKAIASKALLFAKASFKLKPKEPHMAPELEAGYLNLGKSKWPGPGLLCCMISSRPKRWIGEVNS